MRVNHKQLMRGVLLFVVCSTVTRLQRVKGFNKENFLPSD